MQLQLPAFIIVYADVIVWNEWQEWYVDMTQGTGRQSYFWSPTIIVPYWRIDPIINQHNAMIRLEKRAWIFGISLKFQFKRDLDS